MKRIIYFVLLVIVCIGCSLDLPVEDQITGLDAIDNVATANESLSGIYNEFPVDRITFSKLGDDLYPNHTIDDNLSDYNLYKWSPKELVFLSNGLWSEYYSLNTKSNVLLRVLPSIISNTENETRELRYIKAQTLCLKAYAYFELAQLYCKNYSQTTKNDFGIVLKDKIASDELPRSTLEESFKAIEKLLLEAISLFPDENTTNVRFSKNSAKALLAKLYFNWQKYQEAIDLCTELINKYPLQKEELNTVWLSPFNNNEALLAFERKSFYYSSIYDDTENNDEYYVNFNITYSTNDTRLSNSFIPKDFRLLNNTIIKVNFLNKYRNNLIEKNITPVVMIRTAEFYFIKAQSLVALKNEQKAKEVINKLLTIRETTLITSSGESFFSDLLKEKQKEFLGEGNRYFDLKQNQLSLSRVNDTDNSHLFTITPDDYRWLLPIPQIELSDNKAIKDQQNPNWN
ncbi:RagB/SusD family nutrient uptake outer membrane protein [Tenacibaculum sp. nBUS_03]|uniref:RagB/SusD family nutrient uptake outer membrane protein n=1 Tax=Tenacibaculum sp. nBUS_03 TaxID=3395320 RepID=UPI003EB9CFFC